MLIRRFFAFVISAFLIFYPAYAYATTSVGGWTALDTITAGATNTINAAKGAGSSAVRSAVTVAPSVVKVGQHLIKGGGAAAVAFAMVELADGAIDWVLDPANNRITYKSGTAEAGSATTAGYSWVVDNIAPPVKLASPAAVAAELERRAFTGADFVSGKRVSLKRNSASSYTLALEIVRTGGTYKPFYEISRVADPTQTETSSGSNEKSIPISTVAAKVIANAEAGHAPSQEAVKAVALEGFAAGEHDAALDAAAVPDTGVENPPDTENPPVDPAAPFDPSSIIAAINSLKAMLAGILSSMTGFFDWFQAPFTPSEEEKEEVGFATTNDIGLDSVDRFEQRVDFNGQCPSNDFSFSMLGVTYSKPIPYHYFCGFLEQIAPWLLAMCYLGTAYFVVENV